MRYRRRRYKNKYVVDAGYQGLYCVFCWQILQRETVISILQKNFPKKWEEELAHLECVHVRLAHELATDPETYNLCMLLKEQRAKSGRIPPCASHGA